MKGLVITQTFVYKGSFEPDGYAGIGVLHKKSGEFLKLCNKDRSGYEQVYDGVFSHTDGYFKGSFYRIIMPDKGCYWFPINGIFWYNNNDIYKGTFSNDYYDIDAKIDVKKRVLKKQ